MFLTSLKQAHGTRKHKQLAEEEISSSNGKYSNNISTELQPLTQESPWRFEPSNLLSNVFVNGSITKDKKNHQSKHKSDLHMSIESRLHQITGFLKEYKARQGEKTSSEFRCEEWKAVGRVYDRLFFAMFVFVLLTVTVLFLWLPRD